MALSPGIESSQQPAVIELGEEEPGFDKVGPEPAAAAAAAAHVPISDLLLLHEQRITYAMEEWFGRLQALIEETKPGHQGQELWTSSSHLGVSNFERGITPLATASAEVNTLDTGHGRRTSIMEAEEEGKGRQYCEWMTRETAPYEWQKPLRRLVSSMMFESFFAVVIFSNSVFIAYQVEDASQHPGRSPTSGIFAVSSIYTFLFTAELLLRIAAGGPQVYCGEDWMWMMLDTCVVISSLFEFALELPLHQDNSSNNAFSNMRLLRLLRVAKVTRALRIVRVVKFVRSLKSLLFCIGRTMRALAWSAVLLMLIIFVFGLIFTDITAEYFAELEVSSRPMGPTEDFLKERFGSLLNSMHTLYASITGGFTWVEARDVFAQNISEIWGLLFEAYIAFCLFAVLNVMTGVFCHSAIESADKDHEMNLQQLAAERAKYFRAVRRLFARLDKDSDGGITAKEFEVALEDAALIAVFDALEISVEDAWNLFRTLDSDGDSHVGPQEFIDGCLRLKGPARSIDVVCIKRDLNTLLGKLDAQAMELANVKKHCLRRL